MADDKMFTNEPSDECYSGCTEEDIALYIMSRIKVGREEVINAMLSQGNDKKAIERYLLEKGFEPVEMQNAAHD